MLSMTMRDALQVMTSNPVLMSRGFQSCQRAALVAESCSMVVTEGLLVETVLSWISFLSVAYRCPDVEKQSGLPALRWIPTLIIPTVIWRL